MACGQQSCFKLWEIKFDSIKFAYAVLLRLEETSLDKYIVMEETCFTSM